ncbi:hypothetical protein [Deinococcus sp. LM3]|uniref:hypothetical protein n=1 Tax=Deinococcus sp. LM3 TaxID=1938608 RepID=UPI00117DF073|nr:hypothetical protein [Deinococcus sp. LM3]
MKKLMLAAVGLTGILASCGSFGVAPDGTNAVMGKVTTEYKVAGADPVRFVGCDRITNPTDGRATDTQVVVNFTAAGNLSKVDVAIVGASGTKKTQTIQAANLKKNSNNDYQAIFEFKSASNDLIPASIIVSPNPQFREPRNVTVDGRDRVGSFHAEILVYTTGGDTFPITSQYLGRDGNIDVYSKCTLTSTAQPLSQ